MHKRSVIFLCVMAIATMLLLAGCGKDAGGQVTIKKPVDAVGIKTFYDTGDEICTDKDGKPVIREFSTSWCPHCQWIKDTYASVVKDYEGQGKIRAYSWEVDMNDDTLTKEKDSIPGKEIALWKKYNPEGSIPTFVFGCKYARVGNGYEQTNNLAAEEAEFRAVIDSLLNVDAGEINAEADQEDGEVKEFFVTAKKYEFSPSEITVSKGDKVRIVLASEDTTHGFAIPEFGVDTEVSGGETEEVEFVADKAGTFTFYCSVFCGSGHNNMKGTLVVNE